MSEEMDDGGYSPSPPPLGASLPESDSCDTCNADSAWMCVQCNELSFCDACWDQQLPHNQSRIRAKRERTKARNPPLPLVPHEKVTRAVYYRMASIFNQRGRSEHDAAKLHEWEAGAKWFGVAERLDGSYGFLSTDRFGAIVGRGITHGCPEQFPSFVSFIGETGAGKSAVVGMLIAYQRSLAGSECDWVLPVVGDPDNPKPTTGDVQLYPDPATHTGKVPILYADCEGLSGGDVTPRALERSGAANDFFRRHGPLKDIPWVSSLKGGRMRQQVITNLFPKLLYTFSDIVVFVIREARKLEAITTELLIPWADGSMEKSLNQAIKPHVLIVVNAVDIGLDETGWGRDNTTKTHLDVLDEARLDNDAALQPLADKVVAAGGPRIDSVGGLVRHYYASVTVIRLPQTPYYGRMETQVGELYGAILGKSMQSYNEKSRLGVAVDAARMERLLSVAFHQFSQTMDKPFDLLGEAWRANPILEGVAGGLLQFILTFRRTSCQTDDALDSAKLLRALAPAMSSCLLLDAERHNLLGDARHLLRERYRDNLVQAFNIFCMLWLSCSYARKGHRCRNFKSTHTKGHQRDDGKVIKLGPFESDFDSDGVFLKAWVANIEQGLARMQDELLTRSRDRQDLSRKAIAALIHRDQLSQVLTCWMHETADFVSHKLCLFCACQENPEYPLPCGHILCRACTETFSGGAANGEPLAGYRTVICPLHPTEPAASRVHIKPRHAGLRILSLDGGGIRGIVQLAMLRKIENEFRGHLMIQSFFDLVVGTSTGGITALRLFVLNKPLDECVGDFKSLCSKAFTQRRLHRIPVVRNLSTASHGSVYRTKPLEAVLRGLFGEDRTLFGTTLDLAGCFAKVAVTSTESARGKLQPVVVSNYNRPHDELKKRLPYEFLRSENVEQDMKIWEAARATSAAFPYFKSFFKQETGQDFLDGGFYNNCPANVALSERQLLWSDIGDAHPDILLSLGTGRKVAADTDPTENAAPRQRRFILFRTWDIAGSLLENQLECEKAWDDVVRQATALCRKDRELTGRYVRLNVDIPNRVPKLDEVKRVPELEHLVSTKESDETREVAHRLIASCFFCLFRPAPPDRKGTKYQLHAQLRCRFDHGSAEMKGLGRFLRSCVQDSFRPSFRVEPDYAPAGRRQQNEQHPYMLLLPVLDSDMDAMCEGRFSMSTKVAFASPSPTVRISIAIQQAAYEFHGDRYLSISGFPRAVNVIAVEKEAMSLQARTSGHSVYPNEPPPPPYTADEKPAPHDLRKG